jgi:hypothetical protein
LESFIEQTPTSYNTKKFCQQAGFGNTGYLDRKLWCIYPIEYYMVIKGKKNE